MLMSIGYSAVFRWYDGTLVYGKIIAIANNCYLVVVAGKKCSMYKDGMFRFTDCNVVR